MGGVWLPNRDAAYQTSLQADTLAPAQDTRHRATVAKALCLSGPCEDCLSQCNLAPAVTPLPDCVDLLARHLLSRPIQRQVSRPKRALLPSPPGGAPSQLDLSAILELPKSIVSRPKTAPLPSPPERVPGHFGPSAILPLPGLVVINLPASHLLPGPIHPQVSRPERDLLPSLLGRAPGQLDLSAILKLLGSIVGRPKRPLLPRTLKRAPGHFCPSAILLLPGTVVIHPPASHLLTGLIHP